MNKKTKIGLITALVIAFKSKSVVATTNWINIIYGVESIPGNMPIDLEPEYIGAKYTTLGYIAILIISIIS